MASPASIKKHPLHPMLVTVPIGLWIFALVCDIVATRGGTGAWRSVALYCVAGGVVGAIFAAVPGLIDYLSIDEAAMRRIATFHLYCECLRARGFRHKSLVAPGTASD